VIRFMVCFAAVAVLLALATLSLAQDFSADVVNLKRENSGSSKVYATKDKVRFEMSSEKQQMGPSAIIIDETQHSWIVLMAERHMYMDAMPAMRKMPLVSQFWRVQDVDDACPQWKKAAEESSSAKNWGSCTKVGADTVNGRSAVKYEGVSSKGDKGYVWIDRKLHCVIKTDETNGGMELRNIKEESQPASLFEIPAGYTKFDMGMMMHQQQQ